MEVLEQIKTQLSAILPEVEAEDRQNAASKLNCHVETVNRYLRGEVKKASFGLKLLNQLRKTINDRKNALA